MAELDYERMFKKLVVQIMHEGRWAHADVDDILKSKTVANNIEKFAMLKGCAFECDGFKRLANLLMSGEYDFTDDSSGFEEEFNKEYGL